MQTPTCGELPFNKRAQGERGERNEHLYRAPQMPLFTLRHAQGERNTSEEAGCRVLRPFVLSLPVLSLSKGRSMNSHGH